MRRLQSSIQLIERQRNPGIGYWSAANGKGRSGDITPDAGRPMDLGRQSVDSPAIEDKGLAGLRSPTPSDVGSNRNDDEDVNLEVGD